MHYLSDCIASFYVRKDIIPKDHKDIYSYGIELILNEALTFALVLLVSVIMHRFWDGILFLITFCCTRIYTGGFHAKTVAVCRATMIITLISVLGFTVIAESFPLWILILCLIGSAIVLFPLIPVRHPNKTLTEEQKRKGRIKGICIYIFFSVCSIILCEFNKRAGVLINLSLMSVTILAIVGKIRTREVKSDEQEVFR